MNWRKYLDMQIEANPNDKGVWFRDGFGRYSFKDKITMMKSVSIIGSVSGENISGWMDIYKLYNIQVNKLNMIDWFIYEIKKIVKFENKESVIQVSKDNSNFWRVLVFIGNESRQFIISFKADFDKFIIKKVSEKVISSNEYEELKSTFFYL